LNGSRNNDSFYRDKVLRFAQDDDQRAGCFSKQPARFFMPNGLRHGALACTLLALYLPDAAWPAGVIPPLRQPLFYYPHYSPQRVFL
jgi:hypothetical protein